MPGSIAIGDGLELTFVTRGAGEAVVLVHGSLTDYRYWERSEQVERLAARYAVVAYSRRYNHPNRNEVRENHSPMVEARDLARLLDALELGPVHLVGHSYGAYTALVFALENPARVRSLVLAEPPIISWLPDVPGGEGIFEGFMRSVWEPIGAAFRERGDEHGLDATARWYFGVPFDDVEPVWQAFFRENVREWRALALSSATFPKLEYGDVRALQVPVLLLSGGRNAGAFNDLVDGHLERLLSNVRRVVIPDAGHEMFLEFPAESARATLQHLDRHARAAGA